MADAVKQTRKAAKNGPKRIVMTISPKDQEATLMYAELEAAAREDRRDLGEFVLVNMLSIRKGEAWFGKSTQGELTLEA